MAQQENASPGPSNTRNEDRLVRIESMLDQIMGHFNQTPDLLSIAVDSVDDVMQQSISNGIDVDVRVNNGLALLGRLSDPQMNTALHSLLDFVEQAPGLIAMTTDMVDESLGAANSGTTNLGERISSGFSLLEKLSSPSTIEKIEQLIAMSDHLPGLISIGIDSFDDMIRDNQQFLTSNVEYMKMIRSAMSEAQVMPPTKVSGIFSLLRALKDPDRQKAIGLILNITKNIGKKL